MQLAARPRITVGAKEVPTQHWITAGVAVAGLIAVAPGVTPVVPHLQHELQAAAVRLTAGWDPLAAWQTAINTATKNATTLENNFLLAPGVGLQQAIVNDVGFLKEVINDPSSLQTVLTQIATNAQTVASGLTGLNESAATKTAATAHSVDTLHGLLAGFIPGFLPAGTDVAAVTQVLNFLESPASGLLMGAVGPVISPGVALLNSVTAIGAALQAKDPTTALSDLLNVPANAVNAVFNGADLNLDALVPLIAQAGILPAGTTINALDVAFGGLLSVGSVSQGTYTQNGTINPITTPGGSILNSLGFNITTNALGPSLTLNIPSNAVGPIGALEGISQTVGVLLGDHWDGKKAVQTAPLSTLSDTATAKDAAVNPLSSLLSKLTVNSPVTDTAIATATATAENASASTTLVGLPKLHVPVTAPRTVPAATTDSVAAVTDATATATGAAASVSGGGTSGKPTIANNPVRAAISNVSAGITKAVSGGTAKSGASAGSSSDTGKSSASAGSSKGSGAGGRHRK
ncbi:MAG: hypothetical protein JWQ86_1433 [Mycobacterium sp.]|jgi:phenylpyruvate tautomerase PptA (4-oxalocrotonate tautomerase family)|nr:hypothetical protein [Mycobacterium sp.]